MQQSEGAEIMSGGFSGSCLPKKFQVDFSGNEGGWEAGQEAGSG
jgi:hypothetical protein